MSYLLGVHHVNLTIDDKPESIETAGHFYVDLLGLEVLPRPENTDSGRPGYWLALGQSGQQIHISMEENASNYNESRRHSAFRVADLEALQGRLTEAGVKIIGANQGQVRHRYIQRGYSSYACNRAEYINR